MTTLSEVFVLGGSIGTVGGVERLVVLRARFCMQG